MYKRMKPLLLSIVMLFSVCMQGVTAYAAEAGITFTFERGKETAEVGDTVNYKLYIDEATSITNFVVELAVPEGLALVDDADIWKTINGFSNIPNGKRLFANTANVATGTTITEQTLLAEFSCTVNDPSDIVVGFIEAEDDFMIYDTKDNLVTPVVNQVAKVGQPVSGAVTSYINDTDEITVELYQAGEETAAFTTTVTGKSTTYTIEEVPDGEYTMKVAKANHVTREYSVTVVEEAVVQDVEINPVGDANLDGKLTGSDVNAVGRHIAKLETLEGYALQCADTNGDAKATGSDVNAMGRHIAKLELLW